MGLCHSNNAQENKNETDHSKEVDQKLAGDQESANQIFKLLLLGAGDSGKSTLFKQMTLLYGKGFSQEEREQLTQTVYGNVITQMQELGRQKDIFHKDVELSSDLQAARKLIDNLTPDDDVDEKVGDAISILWKEKVIQDTFEKKSQYQMQTSAAWFFDKLPEISKEGYIPSPEDMLRTRVPTTGINERDFEVGGSIFSIMDVGGQRSERRKWIHLFENVTAVLFVSAMSEYDEVLFEDETCNRLTESLKLWEDISNLQWFEKTSMILLLNKSDIFKQKIMKSPLAQDREKYPDYPECDVPENDAKAGMEWIEKQFLSKVKGNKPIYVHFTIATDSKNIFAVFNDVKDIVIKNSLARAGFDRLN